MQNTTLSSLGLDAMSGVEEIKKVLLDVLDGDAGSFRVLSACRVLRTWEL